MPKSQIRKLTRTSRYSYYVTLPREWVKALSWREHQKLSLNKSGKKITVQDWNPSTKKGR